MKELKVILEAQLPKSYQSTNASVEDEQQGEQLHRMRCKLMTAGRHADQGLTEPAKPKAQPGRRLFQQHPRLPGPHQFKTLM